jgi:hypothetical protein
MSIDDYIFQDHWHLMKDSPVTSRRVLLSNGDTVVIGTLTIQGESVHCLYDRSDLEGYTPVAWMDLPLTSPLRKS